MAQLTVYVPGSQDDERLMTLPFEVYGPDGDWLAQGTASPNHPATLTIQPFVTDGTPRVHVVALLPNGERMQQSVALRGDVGSAYLSDRLSSPHEWLQWVTPFRSLSHLQSTTLAAGTEARRRIGRVWMTLWRLKDGRWSSAAVSPTNQMRDQGIRQVTLNVPDEPHLLQVGGDSVAWRLVSLPPGGEVRVALTRSPAADDTDDSIDVTIGRKHATNELIMAYISRGAAVEADRLADAWQAADLALYEKEQDPVSAAAGAYVLLKLKRLDKRRRWVDNLVSWFPFLADGPIIAAALALQRDDADGKMVRHYLDLAIGRGLPVFGLGLSMLVEAMAAVHRGKKESKSFHLAYQAARAYLQACSSKGTYLTFYGKSPLEPSWTRLYGPAEVPVEARSETPLSHTGDLGYFLGTAASVPFGQRLLAGSNTNATDDLLRLGLSRASGMPNVGTLVLRSSNLTELMRGDPLANSLLEASDMWNDERRRSAFNVFEGDE